MRFVHSYWTKPRKDDYDYTNDVLYAALSVSYIKEQGHDIVLYTDNKGVEIFKNIPYDEVFNVLDEELKDIDEHIWSASKFKALELEPLGSVHIDYDFILKDDSIIKFDWYHDMLCQHMIPNNADYDFVSRYTRKACPNLILPEGLHYNFTEHILHLGCWAIYRQELKDKIISSYNKLAKDLSEQFPKELWEVNEFYIPNLLVEEKLVGEISFKYTVACMIDIWNDPEKLDLYSENDICEHYAGITKFKKLEYVKESLKKINENLYNMLMNYE